jgi:hypothetical protein
MNTHTALGTFCAMRYTLVLAGYEAWVLGKSWQENAAEKPIARSHTHIHTFIQSAHRVKERKRETHKERAVCG